MPIPFENGPFGAIRNIPDESCGFGVLHLWEFVFPSVRDLPLPMSTWFSYFAPSSVV